MSENEIGALRILRSNPLPGVCLLRLDRPAKLNAFDKAMRDALQKELETAAADAAVRVVVIAGSEKAFVSGADLASVATYTADELRNAGLHHIWDALTQFPKPIITAVRGYCFGAGCELMMHGDISIVADNATIGQPEIKVGIQPGAGGLSRLLGLVGYQKTMLLTMSGDPISGAQADQWGLAAMSLPSHEVEERALSLAKSLAELPSARLQDIKKVALRGLDSGLTDQLRHEREAYWNCFGTADQKEGMGAFLAKRKPYFNRD